MSGLPTPGGSDVWGTSLNNAIKSVTSQGLASALPGTADFTGQVYYETDTGLTKRWSGSSWDIWGGVTAWTSFTPAWTATSGTPAVGTGGSLTGSYQLLGKTVMFKLNLVLGTTGMSTGSGAAWWFSLPVAHVAAPSGVGQHGIMAGGYAEDLSTRAYASPGARLKASSTTLFELTYSVDNSGVPGSAATFGATSPFTWGSGDYLSIYGMYQAA